MLTLLLVLSSHHQPLYWVCKINGSLSSTWKDFNYLHHLSVKNWCKHFCIVPNINSPWHFFFVSLCLVPIHMQSGKECHRNRPLSMHYINLCHHRITNIIHHHLCHYYIIAIQWGSSLHHIVIKAFISEGMSIHFKTEKNSVACLRELRLQCVDGDTQIEQGR